MGSWEADLKLFEAGVVALFTNKLSEAESIFLQGVERPPQLDPNDPDVHDLRGAFALEYALVAFLRGVGSLADDQLNECASRLERAEALAAQDNEWIGKALIRGVCTLAIGVIQCLQFSFAKGVWNILKSWMYIKRLKGEALDYDGKEKKVVRSAALFAIGMFNMLISFLPPSMLRAASFLSGFEGDRSVGLGMLETCQAEEGILSPFAALVWLLYEIDTKTFLGERQSQNDFKKCDAMLVWALEKYENSVFFNLTKADLAACRRSVSNALEILNNASSSTDMSELKALNWAISYKRGVYMLTDLQFVAAAGQFEESIQIYVEVGRRSMVPFMAMYSALCYFTAADGDIAVEDETVQTKEELITKANAMLDVVEKYQSMSKSNWGRQDRWAFKELPKCRDVGNGNSDAYSPLLELAESMVMRMRCTRWMNKPQCSKLLELLMTKREQFPVDQLAQMWMCCAEIVQQQGDLQQSQVYCNNALELENQLSAEGVNHGIIPMVYYLKALVAFELDDVHSSRDFVKRIESYGRGYWLYPFVVFKGTVLSKRIGIEISDAYKTITVNARDNKVEEYQMIPDADSGTCKAEWDWSIPNHDIEFQVSFVPTQGNESIVINNTLISADDGPNVGCYESNETGLLRFCWNNSYSMLRSKQVVFRMHLSTNDEMEVNEALVD